MPERSSPRAKRPYHCIPSTIRHAHGGELSRTASSGNKVVLKFFRKFFEILLIFGVFGAIVFASSAQHASAAVLNTFSDTLSDLSASANANHEILFRTQTGVTAANKTIVIELDRSGTGFDLSGVSVNDFDFASGAATSSLTERPVASSTPASGVGVAVNYTTDVITLTVASGIVSANDYVRIRIGTNATDTSGGTGPGTERINNPSASSYFVDVYGTFNDVGTVKINILSSGTTSVSASVPVLCGNGLCQAGEDNANCPADCIPGPPPPPVPDTTPPSISNIQALDITTSTARITWTTNESATSIVDYGLTVSYGTTVTGSSGLSHSVTLSGLTQGTLYHFRVRSADGSGNAAQSGDNTFTTTIPGDITPPVISAIAVSGVTGNSAIISWSTNEPATSHVDFGITVSYESGSVGDSALVTAHSVMLTGLASETLYHFRVRSADGSGNAAQSGDNEFTTLDVTAPSMSGIQAVNITGVSAEIQWTTNEQATSAVDYGVTAAYELGTVEDPALTAAHSIILLGLTSQTTYHFRVRSADVSGNTATSSDNIFTTLDVTPPVISGTLVKTVPTSALVSWTTDEAADSRIRYGRTTAYELGTVSSAALETNHSQFIAGLIGNTTYHFTVSSADAAGNRATSSDQVFTTPPDATPPANVANLTATPSVTEITLTWVNPPDADFAGVKIQRSTSGFPTGPTDGITVFQGLGTQTVDTGLTPGTTYYYAAYAYDTSGNFASGALASATTLLVPPPPGAPVCGNGTCEVGEHAGNCPADCPFIPTPEIPIVPVQPPMEVPPVTVPLIEHLGLPDFTFWAASRALILTPTSAGEIQTFRRSTLGLSISVGNLPRPVAEIVLAFGREAYMLQENPARGTYETTVLTPSAIARYAATIIVNYADGTADVIDFFLLIDPYGYVFERVGAIEERVSGAEVTLETQDPISRVWSIFPASAYGQVNPALAPDDGSFGFFVPAGTYRLRAVKSGYRTSETPPFQVTDVLVKRTIELFRIPPPLSEVIDPNASLLTNIGAVTKNLGEKANYASTLVQEKVVQFIENPVVEERAEAIVAPAAVAVVVTNTASAVSLWSILAYLRYLFTQPFLLFERKKRKAWGVVYNAFTKLPVDLAIVRLRDAASQRILGSRVTDREGRYSFIVGAGRYRLEVTKPGYVFPSAALRMMKSDSAYLDIYHNEIIEVTERGTAIAANIPLDPVEKVATPRRVILGKVGSSVNRAVSAAGIMIAGGTFFVKPSALTGGLLLFQLALFFVFREIVKAKKPKGWGIIYDAVTGKPLRYAIARIFETQFNKLLETQVTDAHGRYAFLVGRNIYYVTFERAGYEKKKTARIDATRVPKATLIAENIGLKKQTPQTK